MNKTYLVTGCAGFVGSNLCERLLKDGHTVIGIDNMSTGTQENLDILKQYSNFKFHFMSITSVKDFDCLIDDVSEYRKIDCIFHTAALARIQPAIRHPDDCLNKNVYGLMNILEFMKNNGIRNIVFSSSSSIYGLKHTNKLPLKEEYEPDCLNQYSWSKYAGEQLIKTYCKLYGMNGISLRYFNVFGPREVLTAGNYSPVLGLFFQQVLCDKTDMTIVGDGLQTRDMTHIDDVVEANLMAMEHCDFGDIGPGEVFNVGTGTNISVINLAKSIQNLMKDVLGIDCGYKHIDPRPGEAQDTKADISKAGKFLGWKSKVSFDDGLRGQMEYYLKKYGYWE